MTPTPGSAPSDPYRHSHACDRLYERLGILMTYDQFDALADLLRRRGDGGLTAMPVGRGAGGVEFWFCDVGRLAGGVSRWARVVYLRADHRVMTATDPLHVPMRHGKGKPAWNWKEWDRRRRRGKRGVKGGD